MYFNYYEIIEQISIKIQTFTVKKSIEKCHDIGYFVQASMCRYAISQEHYIPVIFVPGQGWF